MSRVVIVASALLIAALNLHGCKGSEQMLRRLREDIQNTPPSMKDSLVVQTSKHDFGADTRTMSEAASIEMIRTADKLANMDAKNHEKSKGVESNLVEDQTPNVDEMDKPGYEMNKRVPNSRLLSPAKLSAPTECPVCVKMMNDVEARMENGAAPRNALIESCGNAKLKEKETRFCYYIGRSIDAATHIMQANIVQALSRGKNSQDICQKLGKIDAQICELEYVKAIDIQNVDLKKMRVKQLKNILNKWGEECNGCLEKSDFIKRIEELKNLKGNSQS